MAWVGDNGQMGKLAKHGDGAHVEGVARASLERANAALTQHDLVVPFAHDIFSAHKQLIDRGRHAALEQHGLAITAKLLEQREILHVSRAHLKNVDIIEKIEVAGIHDFGNDRHVELALDLREDVEALFAQALEGIGARAGLERPTAENSGTMLFDLLGNDHALLFAFHRTRTGHNGEIALAADFHTANLDDRIIGMELAVRLLEGFGHTTNSLDHAVRFEQIRVNAGRIANQTDNGLVRAFDNRR